MNSWSPENLWWWLLLWSGKFFKPFLELREKQPKHFLECLIIHSNLLKWSQYVKACIPLKGPSFHFDLIHKSLLEIRQFNAVLWCLKCKPLYILDCRQLIQVNLVLINSFMKYTKKLHHLFVYDNKPWFHIYCLQKNTSITTGWLLSISWTWTILLAVLTTSQEP